MCSSNDSRAGRWADKPLDYCSCAWHSLHVTCELTIFIPFFQGIADLVKEHLVLKQKCSPQLLMRCPMCTNDACKNMRRWIETLPWLTFDVVFTAEKKLTCADGLWSHWVYDSYGAMTTTTKKKVFQYIMVAAKMLDHSHVYSSIDVVLNSVGWLQPRQCSNTALMLMMMMTSRNMAHTQSGGMAKY